jgi:hypothetical protein
MRWWLCSWWSSIASLGVPYCARPNCMRHNCGHDTPPTPRGGGRERGRVPLSVPAALSTLLVPEHRSVSLLLNDVLAACVAL